MDISELYNLHALKFGEAHTMSVVARVDESFVSRRVKGLAGRGHDAREQLKTRSTRLVGKISAMAKCSARISLGKGSNKSVFFPLGFASALISNMVGDLHSKLPELSDTQRDYIFTVDVGL